MKRPFDLYVALLVFLLGLYGLIDPNWPPLESAPLLAMILTIEDIYLVSAGVVIMASIIFGRFNPVRAVISEMFGWLFVSSAAWVITLTSWWIPPAIFVPPYPVDDHGWVLAIWIVIWFGLAVSSLLKYLDIRRWTKS